ncbi:MAG: protoporphyrinogen oxidase [Balneolaceae bacterium]
MKNKRIAIVGAGITGLTSAWKLQESGNEVVVFENRNYPGGSIKTVREGDWQIEYGPNTLQIKSEEVLQFIQNLNLDQELIDAGQAGNKRFILREGELIQVPMKISEWVKTPLFSRGGKVRMLKEPFVGRGKDPAETLSSFVERRVGREFLDFAIDPFVSGVYAGTPEQLAVKYAFPKMVEMEQKYGSLTGGALAKAWQNLNGHDFKTRLVSFKNGLKQLPERLTQLLKEVRLNHEVTRLQHTSAGWYIQAAGKKFEGFDIVLLNVPLYRIHEQLIDGGGRILDVLQYAGYPPLSILITGYQRKQVEHPLDGFGFLVPEKENRKILGTLFNSSLFPDRAPEGHVLLTTFAGGGRQPGLASLPSEKLMDLVNREHKEILGVTGEPVMADHIYWPKSIPQYSPDYGQVLEAVDKLEKEHQGLYLIGNYRGGISVPDCIGNGLKWAEKIMAVP